MPPTTFLRRPRSVAFHFGVLSTWADNYTLLPSPSPNSHKASCPDTASFLPIPKETLLHPYLSLSPTWTGNGNWDTNSSPQNSCKNNKSITKLPVPACARVWILIDGFVSNCKCHGVAPAAHISTASRITRHKRKCKSHCGDEKNEITTIICSAERQRV